MLLKVRIMVHTKQSLDSDKRKVLKEVETYLAILEVNVHKEADGEEVNHVDFPNTGTLQLNNNLVMTILIDGFGL